MDLMFLINKAASLMSPEEQYSFTSSLSKTIVWKYAVKIVAARSSITRGPRSEVQSYDTHLCQGALQCVFVCGAE